MQKKKKLPKKEILKHVKKSKNKNVKRILEIESRHKLDWNSTENLVDDRPILSSNIAELLRSAVIEKELNIPSWSTFNKTRDNYNYGIANSIELNSSMDSSRLATKFRTGHFQFKLLSSVVTKRPTPTLGNYCTSEFNGKVLWG